MTAALCPLSPEALADPRATDARAGFSVEGSTVGKTILWTVAIALVVIIAVNHLSNKVGFVAKLTGK